MEAWRKDGVKKLVKPASRTLSLSLSLSRLAASFLPAGTGGTGDVESRPPARRKETLDSMLDFDRSFATTMSSAPFVAGARSLPLGLLACASAPTSSTEGLLRRRLVVRSVFSSEVRSRLKVRGRASGGGEVLDSWDADGGGRLADAEARRWEDEDGSALAVGAI